MDPNRFDTLAKSLTSASRRSALVGLLAGFLAPLLPDGDAAAKPRKRRGNREGKKDRHAGSEGHRHSGKDVSSQKQKGKKKKKKKKKKKEPAALILPSLPPPPPPSPPPPPPPACNPACIAPQSCGGSGIPGACGCTPITACPLGQNCGTVPDGCGGTLSCGTCSVAGQTCGGGGTPGVCGSSDCTPACYNPDGPSRQCGFDGCGVACGFNGGNCYLNQVCNGNGRCECPAGKPNQCSREGCVDLMNDTQNCGACGYGCSSGLTCCNGSCANLFADPFNCGGCGTVCSTPTYACCANECSDPNSPNTLCR